MTEPRDDLAAFREGHTPLIRRLVESHSPGLLSLARGFAWDDDDAHDAVQETWVRVFGARHQLESMEGLKPWLYAVCRNLCLSRARKSAVRVEHARRVRGAGPEGQVPTDEATLRGERRRLVDEAISDLSPRQRAVVVLRILEERTTRETALALGIAEGTVKATLHHALNNLHDLLREHHDVFLP
jgi:RNA polymerase sigma-70 factor (ECF subfamily)